MEQKPKKGLNFLFHINDPTTFCLFLKVMKNSYTLKEATILCFSLSCFCPSDLWPFSGLVREESLPSLVFVHPHGEAPPSGVPARQEEAAASVSRREISLRLSGGDSSRQLFASVHVPGKTRPPHPSPLPPFLLLHPVKKKETKPSAAERRRGGRRREVDSSVFY